MKVIEIAFSCYPVTDLKRVKQFYENTLGLKQTTIWGDDNQAWIEYDIGPSTLAITNFPSEWKPSPDGGGVALEVENFDSAVAELKSAGAKFRVEPTSSPVCHMAVVFDPDGNSICIHKRKPK
jgi:predicted enzyme related to lactoylglutathione lyase